MRSAIIQANGTVTNVIEYDPDSDFQVLDHTIVPDPTGAAEVGGRWDGDEFLPAPPYVPTLLEQETDLAGAGLRESYATLRAWADDAETVAAQGANLSQAQLKATIGRLGKLCDGLADLLVVLNRR